MPQSISEVQYLTISEACKIIPGRPHRNSIIRWFDHGYNGVILENWRCGNRRVTTVSAIDKFLAETSKSATSPDQHFSTVRATRPLGINQ